MTELLSRPARLRRSGSARRHGAGAPTRTVTAAGALAALQSAGLGILAVMVIVLVGWATAADGGGSAGTAVSAALQIWLVGHGADLALPNGSVTLVPLGLTALPVALLHVSTHRAARVAAVTGRRGMLALTSSVAATYAVVATTVSVLADTPTVRPLPVTAFLGAALLATAAAGSAAVRATGQWRVLEQRLPDGVRFALPGALAAVVTLLTAGAVLGGAMLATRQARAVTLVEALDPGAGGAFLLLLGCLAYVPTAVLWGLAYLLGPGFAVGTSTSVSPFGVDLGAVPALPLLAALPSGSAGSGPAVAFVVLPVLAGVLGGACADRMARRPVRPPRRWRAIGAAAATIGALAGLMVSVLAALSSGAIGPGRLAEVGPAWWAVASAAAVEVGFGAAVALAVLRLRAR